jgi:hypothetical protein
MTVDQDAVFKVPAYCPGQDTPFDLTPYAH